MGVGGLISFPEADESKGGRDFFIGSGSFAPLQCDRLSQLAGNSQPIQGDDVQRNFVCRLGHPAHGRSGKGVGGIAVVRPADFHRHSGEGGIFRKTENDAFSGFRHIRMGGDLRRLLFGDAADGSLGVASGLAKGHFDHIPVQALGQGEQGGEHQRGQNDGENGGQIPPSVIPKGAASQHPDWMKFFIFRNGFHDFSLFNLCFLRYVRLRCG